MRMTLTMRLRLRWLILGLLGATFAAKAAAASELTGVITEDNATVIVLSGDIEDGDAAAAEAMLKNANDDGRLVSALRLDSLGGSLAEAVKLAELIRRAKLPTIVAAGSRCASACFIVFAAGIEKFASYGAAIGVHGVSDRFGRQSAHTEAATLSMARIASTFGVPPHIVRQIVITRPSEIAWLSPDDLRTMGTIMTDRSERTASPPAAGERQLAALDVAANLAKPPLHTDQSYDAAAAAAERGDYAHAIGIWRQLAADGDGRSQYQLGKSFEFARGVTLDLVEAAAWYRRAADHGVADARFDLGIAYALGRGVARSLPEAHLWLDLAAATYVENEDRSRAIKAREMVAAKMTEAEIAEAERLALERTLSGEPTEARH
jgi:hypothetical protein